MVHPTGCVTEPKPVDGPSPIIILTRNSNTVNGESEITGELCRPWIRFRNTRQSDRVFLMAKHNFKVYGYFGESKSMRRILSVLDTGAGLKFIRKSTRLPGEQLNVTHELLPEIAGANSNPIRARGTIRLLVRLGIRAFLVEFVVCESLAALLILGCDFCTRNVDSILTRKPVVELLDGTTVPIVRKPLARPPEAIKRPPAQEWEARQIRDDNKVKIAKITNHLYLKPL